MRPPALSGRARLICAALLCLTPLGMVWSALPGYLDGGTLYGTDCGWIDGAYECDPAVYEHGWYHAGAHWSGSQSPVRVLLVLAALALAISAARGRTAATLAMARVGVGALVTAAVYAGAYGAVRPLCAVLGAVALAAPLVVARNRTARAVH